MIELAGELVTLRDLTRADTDAVHTIVGDPRVSRSLSFDARTREQAEAMVTGVLQRQGAQPRAEYYLAVCIDGGALVGFCRLGLSGVQAGKLGYAVGAEHQGRGYASDAVRVLLRFAFDHLRLHRVTAAIGPGNAPSIALVHHAGFRYEGRLRDHVFTNGQWRDSNLYSLLAPEWAARPPAEAGARLAAT